MARLKDVYMLAQSIQEWELNTWTQQDWEKYWVEPKIDGVRFLRRGKEWLSSGGKKYTGIDHITKVINRIPHINDFLIDGELYGNTWEDTLSAARNFSDPRSNFLRYMIFDCVSFKGRRMLTLEARRDLLGELLSKALDGGNPFIKIVPVSHVSSWSEFRVIYQMHLATGCDGSILKLKDSIYETKRSPSWLKVKPSKDMDCMIVSFKEGVGKYKGTLGSIGVVIPIPNFGWSTNETHVSGMSDRDRKYIWEHRDELLGKIVEVKYRRLTDMDRMVEPRFIRIRWDKEG